MATVVQFRPRATGKTALMWHKLRLESVLSGRPIVCAECQRPHKVAPPLGRCVCGSYVFATASSDQLELGLDFHGGEQ